MNAHEIRKKIFQIGNVEKGQRSFANIQTWFCRCLTLLDAATRTMLFRDSLKRIYPTRLAWLSHWRNRNPELWAFRKVNASIRLFSVCGLHRFSDIWTSGSLVSGSTQCHFSLQSPCDKEGWVQVLWWWWYVPRFRRDSFVLSSTEIVWGVANLQLRERVWVRQKI